jgi:hypothetical protein
MMASFAKLTLQTLSITVPELYVSDGEHISKQIIFMGGGVIPFERDRERIHVSVFAVARCGSVIDRFLDLPIPSNEGRAVRRGWVYWR